MICFINIALLIPTCLISVYCLHFKNMQYFFLILISHFIGLYYILYYIKLTCKIKKSRPSNEENDDLYFFLDRRYDRRVKANIQ